jgi:HEAT repeat protein
MRVLISLIIVLTGLYFEAEVGSLQKSVNQSQADKYIELLKSDDENQRQEGKRQLLQLGDPAIAPLLPLLDSLIKQQYQIWIYPKNQDEREKLSKRHARQILLREDVIEILGRLHAREAIPALIYSIDERRISAKFMFFVDVRGIDPDMAALIEIGSPAVTQIIQTIEGAEAGAKRNEDGGAAKRTQVKLAIVLGQIGDVRALPVLEELYEQRKDRHVQRAIEQIKTKNNLK